MKKFKILILIVALSLVFTSCITKADIESKESELEELEDKYSDIEEELESLKEESESLSSQIDEQTTSNEQLSLDIDTIKHDTSELEKELLVPSFLFTVGEFNQRLMIMTTDFTLDKDSGYEFGRAIPDGNTDEGLIIYNYVPYGDIDTGSYIKMSYITGGDFKALYSIDVEYSSEEMKELYDEYLDRVIQVLLSLTESPTEFSEDTESNAKTFIKDEQYLEGYLKLELIQNDDGETTRIYPTN